VCWWSGKPFGYFCQERSIAAGWKGGGEYHNLALIEIDVVLAAGGKDKAGESLDEFRMADEKQRGAGDRMRMRDEGQRKREGQ